MTVCWIISSISAIPPITYLFFLILSLLSNNSFFLLRSKLKNSHRLPTALFCYLSPTSNAQSLCRYSSCRNNQYLEIRSIHINLVFVCNLGWWECGGYILILFYELFECYYQCHCYCYDYNYAGEHCYYATLFIFDGWSTKQRHNSYLHYSSLPISISISIFIFLFILKFIFLLERTDLVKIFQMILIRNSESVYFA